MDYDESLSIRVQTQAQALLNVAANVQSGRFNCQKHAFAKWLAEVHRSLSLGETLEAWNLNRELIAQVPRITYPRREVTDKTTAPIRKKLFGLFSWILVASVIFTK